jgi:hypothetical protein
MNPPLHPMAKQLFMLNILRTEFRLPTDKIAFTESIENIEFTTSRAQNPLTATIVYFAQPGKG